MHQTAELVCTRWSAAGDERRLPVDDPATGEIWAVVQCASPDTVSDAVRAAGRAFEHWRFVAPAERGRLLSQAAATLTRHHEEISRLESHEMGKPLTQARRDVDVLVSSFAYFGGLAGDLPGRAQDAGPMLSLTLLEPYGVIGAVIPFNWPPVHAGAKTAPALAVGNTVVLKPPEQAPQTIMRIVDVLADVLPDDLVHVVPGGADVGQALVAHPGVAKVSFTGSTQAGAHILGTLAPRIGPALLELGGKNVLLVLRDADLELAVACAVDGGFYNQGEACTAASRVLVHETLHDAFLERFAERCAQLRVGDPADPDTHVGPVVSATQRERVAGYLRIAAEEGARVVAQAQLPTDERLSGGYWIAPTVLADVTAEMRVANEEIFGPVVTVGRFSDERDAVAIANATSYGLVAGVISNDVSRAMAIGRRLSVGIVMINNYSRNFFGTPFGGTKGSGYGREHAPETLREYGYSKSFRLPSGLGPTPVWP